MTLPSQEDESLPFCVFLDRDWSQGLAPFEDVVRENKGIAFPHKWAFFATYDEAEAWVTDMLTESRKANKSVADAPNLPPKEGE